MIFNKYKKDLGRVLADARLERDLTQAQVAKRMKLHPQFISNIERGLAPPPNRIVKRLIRMYKLDRLKVARTVSESVFDELMFE